MITNITLLVIAIGVLVNSFAVINLVKRVDRLEKKTNWYQR